MFDSSDFSTAGEVRAAWRADEAEWTRAAHERWEHRQSLVDVVRDCMHRGDTAAFEVGSYTFTGTITSVGADLVRVAAVDGAVDVRLSADAPVVVWVVAPARRGGSRGDLTVTTFAARLRQLEGTWVQVGLRAPHGMAEGELLVGRDQVSLRHGDGRRAYVPIGSVCWVRPVDVD